MMPPRIPEDHENAPVGGYYKYAYPHDPDGNFDDSWSLLELIGLAKRRWEIIVGFMIVGTVGASVWGYHQPITYSATAKILIEPEHRVVDLDSVVEAVGSDAAAIETRLNLLKSSGFLEGFVEHNQYAEASEDHALLQLQQMKEAVEQDRQATKAAFAAGSEELDDRPGLSQVISDRAGRIQKGLKVAQQGRSFIIDIVFTSVDPEEAAQTANELASYYISDQVNRRRSITGDASRFLEARLGEMEKDLLEAEEAVLRYRTENAINVDHGTSVTSERLSDLTSTLIRTRAERKEKAARLAFIQRLRNSGEGIDSLSEVLRSSYMGSIRDEEARLRSEESELRLEFGENHPRIIALKQERAELADRIRIETDRIVANVANELQVLREREQSLNQDMEALTAVASEVEKTTDHAAIQLRILERKAETSRQIYEDFLVRSMETREQEAIVQANTRLVAPAKVPTLPSSSSPLRLALLGLVGSAAAGFGVALVRDKTDRKLRNAKEVAQMLKVNFLGSIPHLSEKDRGQRRFHEYLKRKRASRFAESFRSIYTKLMIATDSEDPPKVILVTSTIPDEGKTTFATSLATMLALDEKKTLLLDLDFRNPSVLSQLDLDDDDDERQDFEAYLRGKGEEASPGIAELKIGCHVLGLASAAKDPGKLLRSSRLSNLMKIMRDRYDLIIIDGPPSLGLSDIKALLALVDSLVFIARWNSTDADVASEAVDELHRCNAPIAGAVLTQVNLKKQARYGYTGGGHYPGADNSYYRD
jgi:capsular exopolysaccharide synthesis family protein